MLVLLDLVFVRICIGSEILKFVRPNAVKNFISAKIFR